MMLFAVQSLKKEFVIMVLEQKHSSSPVCNVSFVHEQETLCEGLSGMHIPPAKWCLKSHITDL